MAGEVSGIKKLGPFWIMILDFQILDWDSAIPRTVQASPRRPIAKDSHANHELSRQLPRPDFVQGSFAESPAQQSLSSISATPTLCRVLYEGLTLRALWRLATNPRSGRGRVRVVIHNLFSARKPIRH